MLRFSDETNSHKFYMPIFFIGVVVSKSDRYKQHGSATNNEYEQTPELMNWEWYSFNHYHTSCACIVL